MTDAAWRRHANPWSVWTRFAAIPLMMLAIWSRVWGWPSVFGAVLVVYGQLWRIDRLGIFYDGVKIWK
nr:DUF6653 family protein [Mycolicibacterium sp. CBMA 361]